MARSNLKRVLRHPTGMDGPTYEDLYMETQIYTTKMAFHDSWARDRCQRLRLEKRCKNHQQLAWEPFRFREPPAPLPGLAADTFLREWRIDAVRFGKQK